MTLQNKTLEELFERWNEILKTTPSEEERIALNNVTGFSYADPNYSEKHNKPEYFEQWLKELPAYYREKAELMLEILTRLKADNPRAWIVSEIKRGTPQLGYFLFVRYLQFFVLKDPLQLDRIHLEDANHNKPKWLWDMMEKGVSIKEIDSLVQNVALHTLYAILSVTDGSGKYGDLPENAPRPRIVEAYLDDTNNIRYLLAIHEFLEDSVVDLSKDEDDKT